MHFKQVDFVKHATELVIQCRRVLRSDPRKAVPSDAAQNVRALGGNQVDKAQYINAELTSLLLTALFFLLDLALCAATLPSAAFVAAGPMRRRSSSTRRI
jgi:hypothetical protein